MGKFDELYETATSPLDEKVDWDDADKEALEIILTRFKVVQERMASATKLLKRKGGLSKAREDVEFARARLDHIVTLIRIMQTKE
jgi:hypothetical protein